MKIGNDEIVDWRFDDWKIMREVGQYEILLRIWDSRTYPFQHVTTTTTHLIGIQFQGKAWEPVKGVPVDREGEFVYGLRPYDQVMDRLLCEITVEDNVKVITLRSTYNVENLTAYPMELVLVDSSNKPTYSVQKIGEYNLLVYISSLLVILGK